MEKKTKEPIPVKKAAPPTASQDFIAKNYSWILLGVIALIGFYLRWTNLGYLSLWGDELFHLFAANSLIEKGAPLLPSGQYFFDAQGFTWLLSVFHRIFGVSETADRMLPMLFGFLTIPMIYILGKEIFKDKRVALMAALFIAVIPWYVIRAKVLRPYTGFQFMYMAFVYLFYKGFEAEKSFNFKFSQKYLHPVFVFFEKEKINIIYVLIALVVLFLGKKFQDLALQAGPTIFVYGLVFFVFWVRQKGFREVRFSKYAWIVYIGVCGIILAPLILKLLSMRPITDLTGMDKNFWERLRTVPFWAFKRYIADAIIALHPGGVWILGLLGIIVSFVKFNKNTFYLLTFFAVPFLIQSFLFNNPNAVKAQYLFFVFPYFLLLAAYGLVYVIDLIAAKMVVDVFKQTSLARTLTILAAVILAYVPLSQSYAFIHAKKHGDLNDKSNELYANWRDASAYVKRNMQADDLVISTQPWSVVYYLGKADYHIRMGFNQYEYLRDDYEHNQNYLRNPNPPLWPLRGLLMGIPILKDYNNFRWTVERYPHGWLLACHKFFNPAFVDKRVVEYVKKNMQVAFVDRDKSIWVLHWSSGEKVNQPPLLLVQAKEERYMFDFPDPSGLQGIVSLQLDVEGVNKMALDNIILNGQGPLPFRFVGDSKRQVVEAVIPPEWFAAGRNELVFKAASNEAFKVYHVGCTLEQGPINYSLF